MRKHEWGEAERERERERESQAGPAAESPGLKLTKPQSPGIPEFMT